MRNCRNLKEKGWDGKKFPFAADKNWIICEENAKIRGKARPGGA